MKNNLENIFFQSRKKAAYAWTRPHGFTREEADFFCLQDSALKAQTHNRVTHIWPSAFSEHGSNEPAAQTHSGSSLSEELFLAGGEEEFLSFLRMMSLEVYLFPSVY